MKRFLHLFLLPLALNSQISLPIDFENNQIENHDFVHFNGGSGYVVYNPQIDNDNPSEYVGVIIRDGGDIWAGSYIELDDYLDFSENTTINMMVLSPYPGLLVKFKIEGDQGEFPSEPATERDAFTTKTNEWEILSWDFSGEPPNTYRKLVLMFDFGNVGDGTLDSTFYFDDIFQSDPSNGLSQMDLPVTFEDSSVYYVLTDFGGNGPSTILETIDGNYARVEKNSNAESWAGVTIGTAAGFLNDIPVSETETKMYVHVYVSGTDEVGIPIRLKIEDSNNPSYSVETDSYTTVSGQWETIEFDFSNQADGTAELNFDYTFDLASLFFNFGNTGNQNVVYYFDNVSFGYPLSINNELPKTFRIYPNPSFDYIFIETQDELEVTIFDLNGKKVFSNQIMNRLDISFLEKGMYVVMFDSGEKKLYQKILKK